MRPLDINREFPIIELKVLGACLGPTIFTVRSLVSYLVRYSVNYQILSEIRLNYKKRIIFFCSFKTFFSFFVTVFLGRNPIGNLSFTPCGRISQGETCPRKGSTKFRWGVGGGGRRGGAGGYDLG